jgi:hypothetical protein
MSAPIVGHGYALLALSPWIIPLIAGAAKLTYGKAREKAREKARGVLRIGWMARRADMPPRSPKPRAPGQVVAMHERLRARVEATIWPD